MQQHLSFSSRVTPLLFSFCLVTVLLFSCDSTSDKRSTDVLVKSELTDSTATAAENKTKRAAQTITGPWFALYMSAKDFKELATKREDKEVKVMFQLCITNKIPGILTLKGWPGRKKGKFAPADDKYILDTAYLDNDVVQKEMFFSSQKLSKNQVGELLAKIGPSDTKYLLFDPEYNRENKHLYYAIYVVDGLPKQRDQTLVAPILSNPSPPASSIDDAND